MKAARQDRDFYRTPPWVVARLLDNWKIPSPATILEPAAGDGAIIDPLRERWPEARIDAFDIAPQRDDIVARAFWFDDGPELYDLVITNPPYVSAASFVDYGLEKLAKGGHLALFLRLGFLGSAVRRDLWRRHMPEQVIILSDRPSFGTGSSAGKTDFSEYGWYIWRDGPRRRRFFRGSIL